ncbi:Protein FAR1-RELATED SEQUENCE 5 [Abeliophyllum distichum]|uniref:Protein FAR1-RELATED SEQUENCE 5 n=1 Tax=Abeliophyllum distichum TaxID=126358 RepID=A0ABD1PC96_9LAMI
MFAGMEAESENNVFVPDVTTTRIPKVGQEFESHEEAYNFYNQYAREAGFSTRIANRNLWVVNKFVAEHNHALCTPSRVHLLRSHRCVTATKKALAQQFSEANIPTCQQLRLMEIDAGGAASIGYVERDLRNHERDIREQLKGHDAETLIEFFSFEKEKSPNFYFNYETDSENTFVRCFWADSESRRSYKCFGEAVVFDTTYNTNKYSMIFAPFVGVNHHGQTVLFGCGLLSNESTESFVWLLSNFLDVMSGQAPNIIITDQDAAIAKSISMVLPLTFHRYCMWHILNKFSEKMNVMVHNEEYHMLVNIIKNSESPDEFEARWSAIMESTTDLGCNEWLCSMYDLRFRWVPAYVKHIFSAGMSSSQRSESGHSFFKRYVNRKNSLMDFVTRFNMALRHQRHEELVANHVDISEQPRLTSKFQMEHQMTFEFEGYPCRHMISYFKKKQVLLLPEKYILRRWTKNAKVHVCEDPSTGISDGGGSSTSLMSRHGMLAHKSSLLVDDAALTDARTTFLIGEFESLHVRIKEIDDGGNVAVAFNRSRSKSRDESQAVHDPCLVRAKGCGKRLKSSKEKSLSKNTRQCGGCGQHGHDKRTCPKLVDRSNIDPYQPDLNDYACTQDGGRDEGTFMLDASSQCEVNNWFQ